MRRFVDHSLQQGSHSGPEGVPRGDFVRKPLARKRRPVARQTELSLFPDLGEEHLSPVACAVDHARPLAPPAMAGTMEMASPALSSVFSPSRKRMSSSPM